MIRALYIGGNPLEQCVLLWCEYVIRRRGHTYCLVDVEDSRWRRKEGSTGFTIVSTKVVTSAVLL
jgi:hypothetical protein